MSIGAVPIGQDDWNELNKKEAGMKKLDESKLMVEINRADIEIKKQHAELLKAQTRRENAEAARIEASNKR